jgi:peptidoglycan/LPS O-acetylase OafA/YrhL
LITESGPEAAGAVLATLLQFQIMGSGTGRNLEIEALRGVAVLMILYAHLGSVWFGDDFYELSRIYVQPGTGVDLFFCISGYVITRHFANHVSPDRNWSSFLQFAVPFWIRRVWRLAPSAWLWLALMLGFSFALDDSIGFRRNLYDVAAAFFQLANLHLYDCRIGLTQVVCGREGYFWSLSLEEQFYFAFPFMVFFLSRRMLIGAVVVIVLAQLPLARTPPLWLIRTDALALGVLIALIQQSPNYQRLAPAFLSKGAIIGWLPLPVCVALISCLEAPQFQFVSFPTGLVALASAVFIWLASFDCGYAVPAGRLRDALMFLGLRSYALYIIHVPSVFIVSKSLEIGLGRTPSALLLAFAIPTALFAATGLNYRFLEMPLRRYGVKVAARFRAAEQKEHRQLV